MIYIISFLFQIIHLSLITFALPTIDDHRRLRFYDAVEKDDSKSVALNTVKEMFLFIS